MMHYTNHEVYLLQQPDEQQMLLCPWWRLDQCPRSLGGRPTAGFVDNVAYINWVIESSYNFILLSLEPKQ